MPTTRAMAVPTRALAITAAALALTTGCASSNGGSTGAAGGSAAATYDIKAGDQTCEVKPTAVKAGDATFQVQNTGAAVTEVYVYAKRGAAFDQVVGEVENVGPGTTQALAVTLKPGKYQVACKPGMTGDGIRTTIKVAAGQRR